MRDIRRHARRRASWNHKCLSSPPPLIMIHDIRFRADSRHAGHDARMQPQGLFDAGVEVRQGFDVGVGGHRVLVGDGGGEFGLDTREVGGVREDFEEGGAQGVG